MIDPVRRRGRQPEPNGVKVVDDLFVDLINAAVTLVGDHEVEEKRGDVAFRARSVLDQVKRRRIGGDVQPTVPRKSSLASVRPARLCGDQLLEGLEGLVAEGDPIYKKKRALDPFGAPEHVDQGGRRPRLSGSRGHDEKKSAFLRFDPFEDGTDCGDLVVAAGDLGIDELN